MSTIAAFTMGSGRKPEYTLSLRSGPTAPEQTVPQAIFLTVRVLWLVFPPTSRYPTGTRGGVPWGTIWFVSLD